MNQQNSQTSGQFENNQVTRFSPKPMINYSRAPHFQKIAEPSIEDNVWTLVEEGLSFAPEIEDKLVSRYINQYQKHHYFLGDALTRADLYLPYVAAQMDANGLPMELALLPFIESAYDPFAVSAHDAAGLWQFIPDTAERMGIQQGDLYDGRQDIVESTDAAIRYLKRLNKQFDGDWLLSLAAYNAGPGTVRKAIRKNQEQGRPTDFWELDLPQQTQVYVPKLIALTKILTQPDKFNIDIPEIGAQSPFEIIEVNKAMDLRQVAEVTNTSFEKIHLLNAGLSQKILTDTSPNRILLPNEKVDIFLDQIDELPKVHWVPSFHYEVQPGDNLSSLAKHYQTTVAHLQSINNLSSSHLKIGQILEVPRGKIITGPSDLSRHLYKVKKGDNLWLIAKRHKVSVKTLLAKNNLGEKHTLRPGDTLLIN